MSSLPLKRALYASPSEQFVVPLVLTPYSSLLTVTTPMFIDHYISCLIFSLLYLPFLNHPSDFSSQGFHFMSPWFFLFFNFVTFIPTEPFFLTCIHLFLTFAQTYLLMFSFSVSTHSFQSLFLFNVIIESCATLPAICLSLSYGRFLNVIFFHTDSSCHVFQGVFVLIFSY